MFRLCVIGLFLSNIGTVRAADPPIARLIFQDHNTRTLKWADVTEAQDGKPVLGAINDVVGFPKLDGQSQSLVQMKEYKGRLLVGVRGDEDGLPGSGWVMISTGTKYTDHGDHGHWSFKKKPQVIAAKIDSDGGNPAHLYLYDGQFYLANDKRNGYTRFDPEQFSITTAGTAVMGKPQFVSGGGNHITLATVAGKVGYGTWIDGGGPNKGRVDVTPLDGNGKAKYSFNLPTGVIHGATACVGKVFFAPADGICWVEADLEASKTSADIKVNHISLGKEGEKPLRTGAFATHGHHVLCVTGKGTSSQLVLLNANAKDLQPQFLKLSGKEGHKPLTPVVSATKDGKNLQAFVFHDHDAESKIDDICEVVALDPNGDGKWDDAKVVKTLTVGPSAVSGHYGHHDIAFDADAKFAYITNPGDGTITVVDLKTLKVTATLKVGGKPTALVVVGAKDHDE